MLLIYATLSDNTRTLLTKTTDITLDVQTWANSRIESFKILDIISIEYEII